MKASPQTPLRNVLPHPSATNPALATHKHQRETPTCPTQPLPKQPTAVILGAQLPIQVTIMMLVSILNTGYHLNQN